jgi:hypothetical protein
MDDLRRHLEDHGLDPDRVLPDWWDDKLAEVPFNRSVAESYVARATGTPVSKLRRGRRDRVAQPRPEALP